MTVALTETHTHTHTHTHKRIFEIANTEIMNFGSTVMADASGDV